MSTDTPGCPKCGSIRFLTPSCDWACGSRVDQFQGFQQSDGCKTLVNMQQVPEPATSSSAAAERCRLTDEQIDRFSDSHIMAPEEWELVAQAKEANALRQQLAAANATLAAVRQWMEKRPGTVVAESLATVLDSGGAALLERVAKLEAIDKAAGELLALMIDNDSMQQPEYLDSRSFTHEEFEPLRAARKAAKR